MPNLKDYEDLRDWLIEEDGNVTNDQGEYIEYKLGSARVVLDGEYSILELEALAQFMRDSRKEKRDEEMIL